MNNFQKYSTTNISGTAAGGHGTGNFSNLNSSMGYMSNSSMKRQSSGNTRQEQSVERLKSCIADLKKLASNKIKRQVNNYVDQAPSFGDQNQTPSSSSQYGHETKYRGERNSQNPSGKSKQSKQPDQYSNNNNNHHNYEIQQQRKNHQTKIANQLKKYMNETEQTSSVQANQSKLDQNYREMLNQVSGGPGYGQSQNTTGVSYGNIGGYSSKHATANERTRDRESHRGRSSANGSNKKRTTGATHQSSQRGNSATGTGYHHQREDSHSKKEKENSLLMGSNKKRGSSGYASQKKQMENSIRSNKYSSEQGYSQKQQPRKAKSQDRFHAPNGYQASDKPSPSNLMYQNFKSSNQTTSKTNRPQSSSVANMNKNKQQNAENLYPESYSAIAKSGAGNQQKDRKPFVFQNYLLNQSDTTQPSSQSQGYKIRNTAVQQPFLKTDTFVGHSQQYATQGASVNYQPVLLSNASNPAVDIRIKNNKHGETDYMVVQSPTSHQNSSNNVINLTDNKLSEGAGVYGTSGRTQSNSRRVDSNLQNNNLAMAIGLNNAYTQERSQRSQSQNPLHKFEQQSFGMKNSDSQKDRMNTTQYSQGYVKSSTQPGSSKVRKDFKQISNTDKNLDQKIVKTGGSSNQYQPPKQQVNQAFIDKKHSQLQQEIINPSMNNLGGIRSLQEAAILTHQSTDLSENRIQSLEHQKRILSLQNQNPSSIYSNSNIPNQQQSTNQNTNFYPTATSQSQNPTSGAATFLLNQQTTSSLQNQNGYYSNTYGYGNGQSTMNAAMANMMRTANVTREDFNIEDLHSQVVYKLQRTKKLIREIELLPQEREFEYMLEDTSEFGSGRGNMRYQQQNNKNGNNQGRREVPQQVILLPQEEIICGDGCSRPAILFGRVN
eukprot:403330914